MAPMDPEDLKQYHGSSGRFFNSKNLKPGETLTIELLSIDKQYKTQYPIAGKDYCYRVSFKDDAGELRIMDCNGADLIRQITVALYPQGADGALVPCHATISRRTERRKTQSELMVIRVDT